MDDRPGIGESFDWTFADEVGNENDLALGRRSNFQHTDAANLKPSASRRGCRRNQSAGLSCHYDLIVGNKLDLIVQKRRRTECQSAQSEV
jgi:hypothetical protein